MSKRSTCDTFVKKLNKLAARQTTRDSILAHNDVPSDTEEDNDIHLQEREVQVPSALGVIASSSDVDEGECTEMEASRTDAGVPEQTDARVIIRTGSLRSQEEVVYDTQPNFSGPWITREGTLLQEDDEEESPALFPWKRQWKYVH